MNRRQNQYLTTLHQVSLGLLRQDNPLPSADKPLEKLAESLNWQQIEPIQQNLDSFDFSSAKKEIVKLADSLKIKL